MTWGLPNAFADASSPWSIYQTFPISALLGGIPSLIQNLSSSNLNDVTAAFGLVNLFYLSIGQQNPYSVAFAWLTLAAEASVKRSGGGTPAKPHATEVSGETEMITCEGPALFSAVGPDQAKKKGALYSDYVKPSILGGTMGTVAAPRGFLGFDTPTLRKYGTQIVIDPSDGGRIPQSGGPAGPYTVSDWGDKNIKGNRFDVYRWDTQEHAIDFGKQKYKTTITFPAASGGVCPDWKDWRQR